MKYRVRKLISRLGSAASVAGAVAQVPSATAAARDVFYSDFIGSSRIDPGELAIERLVFVVSVIRAWR